MGADVGLSDADAWDDMAVLRPPPQLSVLIACASRRLRQQAHSSPFPTPTSTSLASLACCCAGALNDFQKDLQFRKLNAQKDVIDVKVVRSGKTCVIKNNEIVVGDILMLDTGARADTAAAATAALAPASTPETLSDAAS